jgi:hypothetical protein
MSHKKYVLVWDQMKGVDRFGGTAILKFVSRRGRSKYNPAQLAKEPRNWKGEIRR